MADLPYAELIAGAFSKFVNVFAIVRPSRWRLTYEAVRPPRVSGIVAEVGGLAVEDDS